ncbi:MAG: PHP domain-containing protein [Oscillospiraceae bacterium]|nr:PHP domain-containing protein [Oscillospiraceae bacterium]
MAEFLYETHMHTSEVSACAANSAKEQIKYYKIMGYTGVIVTDHFVNGNNGCDRNLSWNEKMHFMASGYENAKIAGDELGVDVFFGWEFSIRGSDFLTYGLDLDFLLKHPGIDRMGIEKYSATVRKHGGYIAQAHPFREAFYIEKCYPVSAHLLDGIEVFNAMDSKTANAKALSFAEEYNLPKQSGSDSHSIGNYIYGGIKLRERAQSFNDIINAIKSRNIELIM